MLRKPVLPGIILLLMLTGCDTISTTEAVIDTSCDAFEEIYYDCPHPVDDAQGILRSCGGGDTARTVIKIREHNAVYMKLKCDR